MNTRVVPTVDFPSNYFSACVCVCMYFISPFHPSQDLKTKHLRPYHHFLTQQSPEVPHLVALTPWNHLLQYEPARPWSCLPSPGWNKTSWNNPEYPLRWGLPGSVTAFRMPVKAELCKVSPSCLLLLCSLLVYWFFPCLLLFLWSDLLL